MSARVFEFPSKCQLSWTRDLLAGRGSKASATLLTKIYRQREHRLMCSTTSRTTSGGSMRGDVNLNLWKRLRRSNVSWLKRSGRNQDVPNGGV